MTQADEPLTPLWTGFDPGVPSSSELTLVVPKIHRYPLLRVVCRHDVTALPPQVRLYVLQKTEERYVCDPAPGISPGRGGSVGHQMQVINVVDYGSHSPGGREGRCATRLALWEYGPLMKAFIWPGPVECPG